MARFGGNLPRILLSMRWDFLWSLHLFSLPTFSPYLPGILFHVLGCIYKLNPNHTPLKSKRKKSSHAKHTHHLSFLYQSCFLLVESTSSSITHTLSSPMAVAIAEAQFHVLAVDDSLPDRKLIERLLKTSSFQGINHTMLLLVLFAAPAIFLLWHLMQSFVGVFCSYHC